MKTFGWLTAAAALGLLLAGARAGENLKGITAQGLQGHYRIVGGEKDGKQLEKADIEGAVVHITPDRIISFDRDRKQTYAADYKIDSKKDPAVVHMVSIQPKKGARALGLVTRRGDQVKLIYALPGGKAPTEFKAGERQMLLVLETIKEEKKENKK